MYRGCVFCKMKDAILGCMGGKPDTAEEVIARGEHSDLLPRPQQQTTQQKTILKQTTTRNERRGAPSQQTTDKRGDRRKTRPTYLQLREVSTRQEPKLGIQSRSRTPRGQGQGHDQAWSSPRGSSITPDSWQSYLTNKQTPQPSTSRYRSPPRNKSPGQTQGQRQGHRQGQSQGRRQGQGQIRRCTDYDQGHIKAHYCKLYEKQYRRDLLKREAARLPLLEYTYRNGKPIRGILKKSQFVRTPRMDELIVVEETERSKEAFMDMLASRYPQYAEKISSTASEDGFPTRGRSRDPRRRATVGYSQQHNRSMDYEGTLSEVDGPTFHRGGYSRSSLPPGQTPPVFDKPPGLVFLIFRDETKKALLPNEITHLDTVRAMFVRSFPGKLTMSYLESPRRKIYMLDPRTNIYFQLEDLRDIKDRTVLRVHECDSEEPQRLIEKPEVRGRTIHLPTSQGYYQGATPASSITSQVHKAQTLPAHMHHPIYMSHDDVTQSPARTGYERSRSLTPDPSRSVNYAQNPIYGRMGISPERPPPPQDRTVPPDRPPSLRPIPENHLMLNGMNRNGNGYMDYVDGGLYQAGLAGGVTVSASPGGGVRVYPRQAMSPPAIPTQGPRVEPGRRAFSPPPNLQNYDYIQVQPQVVPGSQPSSGGAKQGSSMYVAKGVRASTVVTPQRASQPVPGQAVLHRSPGQLQQPGQQTTWRERSPVGRHSLPLSAVPYNGTATMTAISSTGGTHTKQRSQSYRVAPTSERDPTLLTRPRSVTPSPMDPDDRTQDRINKMEHQLASLAAWVQSAVYTAGSTGAPSSGAKSSTNSVTSDTSPLVDSAGSKLVDTDRIDGEDGKGLTDLASDGTTTAISHDMRHNILSIKFQADALRSDLRSLRRLQQINKESILETVDDAWKKIKEALSTVPGAENLLIRQQRSEVDVMYKIYLEDKAQAEKELLDLEHEVEQLRSDVLSRQCRVNMSDVEGMALVLSHVTKALGELKARLPKLQERMKYVMTAEMDLIIREEKFLKEEPEKLDNSLKKCKKLTGTLFTLKRLASVQEHRPPQQFAISAHAKMPTMEDKKAVLENIQAMVPDHEARIQGIMAAETSRQRKKKITTQQEALRFGKSLELATKALKPSATQPGAATQQQQPGGTTSQQQQQQQTQPGGATTQQQQTGSHSQPSSRGGHSSGAQQPEVYASSSSSGEQKPPSSSGIGDDTSSIISFVMPMSTSTPKSASQPSTSRETSVTSPSVTYPVMSLMKDVQPRPESSASSSSSKGHPEKIKGRRGQEVRDRERGARPGKAVDAKSQPAVLPVTSTETSNHKDLERKSSGKSSKSSGGGQNQNGAPALSSQKSAARAAFFSSLSSPQTPTTSSSPLTITSPLITESPTEGGGHSVPVSASPGASPVRGIPSLVRSSAVTLPPSSYSTSVTQSHVPKPSSLPVSTSSSVVSSQKFSPASPSRSEQPSGSKPRTTFTAIPKPYSPTKSTPSPLTPESPKYRLISSTGDEGTKKLVIAQPVKSKDPIVRPKKIPPPPPPRKSSRLPGHAVLAVNAATLSGQLTPTKKKSEEKAPVTKSESLGQPDVIEPPKQFANLDTKVERKSSVGSLKQFTTPLLESKRDIELEQKQKKEKEAESKKISASNLDSSAKSKQKVHDYEKELDLSLEDEQTLKKDLSETSRKVIDGKVTNISAEDRMDSLDSLTSSGGSIDSQQEVWIKKEDDSKDESSSVTESSEERTDQSAAASQSTTADKAAAETDAPKSVNGHVGSKKPKPPPPQRRSSLTSKTQTDESSSPVEAETIPPPTKGVIDRLV